MIPIKKSALKKMSKSEIEWHTRAMSFVSTLLRSDLSEELIDEYRWIYKNARYDD